MSGRSRGMWARSKSVIGVSNLLFGNQCVQFVIYVHERGFPAVHFCAFSTGF